MIEIEKGIRISEACKEETRMTIDRLWSRYTGGSDTAVHVCAEYTDRKESLYFRGKEGRREKQSL